MIFGMLAGPSPGFRMKGESFSSGFGAPVETRDVGTGSAFFASRGTGATAGWKGGGVVGATGPGGGATALNGPGSGFIAADSAGVSTGPFAGADSGASRFNMRMLPVWLSVRTGSASAIKLLDIFHGEAERAGPVGAAAGSAPVAEASLAGGAERRMHGGQGARTRFHRPDFKRRGSRRGLRHERGGIGLIAGGLGSAEQAWLSGAA